MVFVGCSSVKFVDSTYETSPKEKKSQWHHIGVFHRVDYSGTLSTNEMCGSPLYSVEVSQTPLTFLAGTGTAVGLSVIHPLLGVPAWWYPWSIEYECSQN